MYRLQYIYLVNRKSKYFTTLLLLMCTFGVEHGCAFIIMSGSILSLFNNIGSAQTKRNDLSICATVSQHLNNTFVRQL